MSEIKTNPKDLLLLGRSWEYITLPSDRRFLEKYFTTDIQGVFFRYIYVFDDYVNFIDHTGFFVTKRYMQRLYKEFNELIESYTKAKKDFDLDMIVKIEDGKFFNS